MNYPAIGLIILASGIAAQIAAPSSHAAPVAGVQCAYVLDGEREAVYQFAIRQDGSLAPFGQPCLATGRHPVAAVASPDGRFLYVANRDGLSISVFRIGTDGSLSYVSPTPVALGGFPSSLAIDASGRYIYAACSEKTGVYGFHIAGDGTLVPLPTAALSVKDDPASIVIVGRSAYVSYRRRRVIDSFAVADDGALMASSPGAPIPNGALCLAVPPAGGRLYATVARNIVIAFRIAPDGSLLPTDATSRSDDYPTSMSFTPDGRYAYTANRLDSTVSQFSVAPNGALSPLQPPSVPSSTELVRVSAPAASPTYVSRDILPGGLAVDAGGRACYVANGDGSVSVFKIGPAGDLSPAHPALVSVDDKALTAIVIVRQPTALK